MNSGESQLLCESRQRNSQAVQRLFQKRLTSAASTTSCAAHSTSHQQDRRPRTTASAVELVGGPTFGPKQRRSWVDCVGHGGRADLDTQTHLGMQLNLAVELNTLTPEHHSELLAQSSGKGAAVAAKAAPNSCFALQLRKARHEAFIEPAIVSDVCGGEYGINNSREHSKAYHHQQAILRHERSLPLRRTRDQYLQLTGAQLSTSRAVPNAYTATRLAEREHGQWALDNNYRQQLLRGEPVMTRVMRGEFYVPPAAGRTSEGAPAAPNIIAKNKRDVRIASQINRAEQARSASALVGGCVCKS